MTIAFDNPQIRVNCSVNEVTESATQLSELPVELITAIFRLLDVDTVAKSASLVCRAWSVVARDAWMCRLSPRLQAQLAELAALGPSVSPIHLYLALSGRNFLRNPGFRRDANSVIVPPLGSLGAGRWKRWQRTAWVLNTSVGKEVSWEPAPLGMTADGSSLALDAPEPPLPYPGDDRLVSCMRRALKGLVKTLMHTQGGSFSQPGASAAAGDRGLEMPGLGPGPGTGQPLPPAATRQQQQQQMAALQGCDAAGPDAQQTSCGSSCLATLGTWSEVAQVIDLDWELQRRGLTAAQAAHLLDAGLSLTLSVHVGARSDTAAEYGVALMLDERDSRNGSGAAAADAIPSLQSFVQRPSRHLGYREREFVAPGTWERFEYVLDALPGGARRAIVMLRGRRSPTFSAGRNIGLGGRDAHSPSTRFCGAIFSSAQLVFG
ncbi:hypothetical protein VaNZ11_000446 [Volvox africanus]|uniref:F-box domain-containing protein n=1 Tax=Volvox africanus TaxID=51714 RepID=A0ABQ5RM77_9CHLO|nr:hypothetical protein VaNZ11_000446 [Volvox africanus]